MRNGKFSYLFISITFLLLFSALPVSAQTDYVLPYPSLMPGSLFYKAHLVWEEVMRYWYFGDFGQFSYNLKQADKYLVEAKTLFEYKQYLLGMGALKKSDSYFAKVQPHLLKAQERGKNISAKQQILKHAVHKHTEVLIKMKENQPRSLVWSEEKKKPVVFYLKQAIEEAVAMRRGQL